MVLRGVSSRVHVTAISFNRTSFSLHIKQCLETTVFIDDGAPPHNSREMTSLLRAHFRDKSVISRGFRTVLPPHSLDLNACDFRLWRFLKDHAYSGNMQTVLELEESIPHHVISIDRETLRTTVEHNIKRFEYMIIANGIHIE